MRNFNRKRIWSKFIKAINDFNLIEDGDKIAIGISGGKDSILLVNLFKELKKDKSRNFEFVPITLNPGFKEKDLKTVTGFLDSLETEYDLHDTNIWEVAFQEGSKNPCFLCAKMRRGILYRRAEELGCNKLALGHHFDDIIETVMINMFYAGTIKTMLPKVKSTSGNFEVIRPLAYIKEESIISYKNHFEIEAMNCGCKIEEDKIVSKRKEIKILLKDLEKTNPNIKNSIFNSIRNVNLDYVINYVKSGEEK